MPIRAAAWAIQAGILEAIGAPWNELRMIKQAGHHAGVKTFPDAIYQGSGIANNEHCALIIANC
jgi:hypothetical protein